MKLQNSQQGQQVLVASHAPLALALGVHLQPVGLEGSRYMEAARECSLQALPVQWEGEAGCSRFQPTSSCLGLRRSAMRTMACCMIPARRKGAAARLRPCCWLCCGGSSYTATQAASRELAAVGWPAMAFEQDLSLNGEVHNFFLYATPSQQSFSERNDAARKTVGFGPLGLQSTPGASV